MKGGRGREEHPNSTSTAILNDKIILMTTAMYFLVNPETRENIKDRKCNLVISICEIGFN